MPNYRWISSILLVHGESMINSWNLIERDLFGVHQELIGFTASLNMHVK